MLDFNAAPFLLKIFCYKPTMAMVGLFLAAQ
jgi:hypothetical protein